MDEVHGRTDTRIISDTAYGLKSVALRYFNAAGATEKRGEHHDPETHLIPNVLSAADGKLPFVSVFGNDYDTPDGTCIRDYIHIADLGDAHIRALDYLGKGNHSTHINLGNGKGFSVLEVIDSGTKGDRQTDRSPDGTAACRRAAASDRRC